VTRASTVPLREGGWCLPPNPGGSGDSPRGGLAGRWRGGGGGKAWRATGGVAGWTAHGARRACCTASLAGTAGLAPPSLRAKQRHAKLTLAAPLPGGRTVGWRACWLRLSTNHTGDLYGARLYLGACFFSPALHGGRRGGKGMPYHTLSLYSNISEPRGGAVSRPRAMGCAHACGLWRDRRGGGAGRTAATPYALRCFAARGAT